MKDNHCFVVVFLFVKLLESRNDRMYYFDNAATTKPLPEIISIMNKVTTDYFANPSSAHQLGVRSQKLLQQARHQVAELLKYKEQEIIFTSSGTESNNWVFTSVIDAQHQLRPDRNRVLLSSIEHPCVRLQKERLEQKGYQVEVIPVNEEGIINLEWLKSHLNEDVLFISTILVNNEVGTIQPVEEISELLVQHPEVIWHVDGVQGVTTQFHHLIHPRIDLLSLSGHKFHSIRGAGLLTIRQRVARQSLLLGGGQELGLRSSTENLAAIVCFSKALRLAYESQQDTKERLNSYHQQINDALKEEGWTVFGDREYVSEHIICAALPLVPGEVLIHAFGEEEVFISTTSACSSRKHRNHSTLSAMKVSTDISNSAIRISLAKTTTQSDVDYLIKTIQKVSQSFKTLTQKGE